MQAKLLSQNSNARNYATEKEQIGYYKLIAFAQDTFRELVDVRVYAGRSRSASTVYASIWVHSKDYYTSGTGRAGGGGYHKSSAAIAEAIASAGIELDHDISGRGDSAVREALHAIGSALGFETRYVVEG